MACSDLINLKNNVNQADKNQGNNLEIIATKKDNVLKKDYVLNELEALKKKLDNEDLKPEISISSHAVDGSNATISMKTSLYEYAKVHLTEAQR